MSDEPFQPKDCLVELRPPLYSVNVRSAQWLKKIKEALPFDFSGNEGKEIKNYNVLS